MSIAFGIGIVLALLGGVLLYNVGGTADALIRRVTSRSLGELAPGFAASRRGLRVYAILLLSIGVTVTGLGITLWSAPVGASLLALGAISFVIASVIAIVGEVETYRSLKR